MSRKYLGIELLVLIEVFTLEALAINLVNFIELQSWFRLECGECSHGLGGQSTAVYEEQNPLCHTRFHQAINLIDRRERLASARRHCDKHLPLPVGDGLLNGGISVRLIEAEAL